MLVGESYDLFYIALAVIRFVRMNGSCGTLNIMCFVLFLVHSRFYDPIKPTDSTGLMVFLLDGRMQFGGGKMQNNRCIAFNLHVHFIQLQFVQLYT